MPSSHDTTIIKQFTQWAENFAHLPIHAEEQSMAQTVSACDVSRGTRVLDVACGPGIVACALAEKGAEVTGIDLTPAMIAQAQILASREGVEASFRCGNACQLPFEDGQFDRVVTRYSFHHMKEPQRCLAEMARVCRPDGRLVVIDATPTPESQQGYDEAETLRDPSHTNALTREQLLTLGSQLGLTPVLCQSYRLESCLSDQVAPEDEAALHALFARDIAEGQNRLGMEAWHADDGIRFFFPISIIAWHKTRE